LYGQQKAEISINDQNSIVDRFMNKNWNKLDETIPECIYDIAVSESRKNIYYRNPESITARDFAFETAKKLDIFLCKNKD
jgi:hypothetical protein